MRILPLILLFFFTSASLASEMYEVECTGKTIAGDVLKLKTCVSPTEEVDLSAACGDDEDTLNTLIITKVPADAKVVVADTLHGEVTKTTQQVYEIPGDRISISLSVEEDLTLIIKGKASYFGSVSLNTGYVDETTGAQSNKLWTHSLNFNGEIIENSFKNFTCKFKQLNTL